MKQVLAWLSSKIRSFRIYRLRRLRLRISGIDILEVSDLFLVQDAGNLVGCSPTYFVTVTFTAVNWTMRDNHIKLAELRIGDQDGEMLEVVYTKEGNFPTSLTKKPRDEVVTTQAEPKGYAVSFAFSGMWLSEKPVSGLANQPFELKLTDAHGTSVRVTGITNIDLLEGMRTFNISGTRRGWFGF